MPRSTEFKQPRAFRPAARTFRVAQPIPRTLRLGFWVLLGISVVQAVALIWHVVVFDFDAYLAETVHTFERNGRELQVTPELAIATWAIGIAASALAIGLRVGFTLALRRGYNWARIVLTILFAGPLLPPYDISSIGTVALDVLIVVPNLAGIVFIWLPQSNAFFREVKRARVAHKAKEFG